MRGVRIPFIADGSGFNRGLDQMRAKARRWSGQMRGLIKRGLAFAGVTMGLKSFMDQMDRIGKLSTRVGMSAEELQRLGHVAEMSGTSLELVANILTRVQRRAGDAALGSKPLQERFKQLGIDFEKFAQMSPTEQFLELTRAFNAAEGSVEGVAAMMGTLDTEVRELFPAFQAGVDGVNSALEEAEVVTDNTVKSIESANDQITRFKNQITAGLGKAIQVVRSLGVGFESWGRSIAIAFEGIMASGQGIQQFGLMVGNALSGNFDKARESAARMGMAFSEVVQGMAQDFEFMNQQQNQKLEDIWAEGGREAGEAAANGFVPGMLEEIEEQMPEVAEAIEDGLEDIEPTVEIEPEVDDSALDDLGDKLRPSASVSSLQEIGGGGSAFVSGLDPALREAQEQTRLLQRIADNTTNNSTTANAGGVTSDL